MARRRGMSPDAAARFRDSSTGTYTGTRRIEQERERVRLGESERYPTTPLKDISPWYPGQNHPPDESSRVQAFKFVPSVEKGFGNVYGTVFVSFIKNETPWKYTDIPETTYQAFFASPSKGRFINTTLNQYPYGRVSGDELSAYFSDM